MRKWLIKKLNVTVEDLDKHEVLTLAVKKLFNTISAEDVLKEKELQWFFQGKALRKDQVDMLKAEATNFNESFLWKVLSADIKYHANKQMFIKSRTEYDIMMGKSWLYVLDVINTRLKSLVKGIGLFNKRQ